MVRDMLAIGRPPPVIAELDDPHVRVALLGGPPDAAVVALPVEAATGERIAALEAVGAGRPKGREAGLDEDRGAGREGGASARGSAKGPRHRAWNRSGHRRASTAVSVCSGIRSENERDAARSRPALTCSCMEAKEAQWNADPNRRPLSLRIRLSSPLVR